MSTIEVNTIKSISGTNTLTIGESGDTIALTSGAKTSGFGKIGQVVSATKTDFFSMSSTTYANVTDLAVSITPTTTSSKILLLTNLSLGAFGSVVVFYRVTRNDSALTGMIGSDTASFQATGGQISYPTSTTNGVGFNFTNAHYLDSPASTSAQSYKVQIKSNDGAQNVYVNRRGHDTYINAISSITAMEILD